MSDSDKLKQLRSERHLTQAKLAEELEVSKSLVIAIESGERNISLKLLKKIQEKYNRDLMNFEGNTVEVTNNVIPIPFYHTKAAAGFGEALPDYPEKDVIYFDARWLKNILGVNPKNLAIIQAKGNSMDGGNHPIKDGDLLMVDESYKEPVHNQIFVVNLGNNDIVVKRINRQWDGSLMLDSNNPSYPSLHPTEEASIIGKVVWNGSKENV